MRKATASGIQNRLFFPALRSSLAMTGLPLTATSANISGQPEAEFVDEICDTFGDKIDLYLDGGGLNSLSSTVIECYGNEYKILREGAISAETINKKLTEI